MKNNRAEALYISLLVGWITYAMFLVHTEPNPKPALYVGIAAATAALVLFVLGRGD